MANVCVACFTKGGLSIATATRLRCACDAGAMRNYRIARASQSQTHSQLRQRCDGLTMQMYPLPVIIIAFLTANHL
jgi:hypothetical protein